MLKTSKTPDLMGVLAPGGNKGKLPKPSFLLKDRIKKLPVHTSTIPGVKKLPTV